MSPRRISHWAVVIVAAAWFPSPRGGVAGSVTETEPNDWPEQANIVTFGDTVTGAVSSEDDFDWFAVDLTAGTMLEFAAIPAAGSDLQPYIVLLNPDTGRVGSAEGDGTVPTRVLYAVPTSGRYFLGIAGLRYSTGAYRCWTRVYPLNEVEPNNTIATANVVALEDSMIAFAQGGEADYFAVDVPTGTHLSVAYATVTNPIGLVVTLYGMDGTSELRSESSYGPLELRYRVTAGGRYYVSATPTSTWSGLYALFLRAVPTGPGDTASIYASGLGRPVHGVAGLAGQIYVKDADGNRILRVSATGEVSVLADAVTPKAMVVDGYGDLLISSSYDGIVRITDAGDRSVFAPSIYDIWDLAVGRDGDVWALACDQYCPGVFRFDPSGQLKSVEPTPFIQYKLAFSPSGVLHYISTAGITSMASSIPKQVIFSGPRTFTDVAFDEDGYLYISDDLGEVRLYNSSYEPVAIPFATRNLGPPLDLLFLRDTAGRMTSRLLTVNGGYGQDQAYQGTIMELNPAGIRAPGYPEQPRLLHLVGDSLEAGRVGTAYSDTLRVLDGLAPFSWHFTSGTPPAGITLGPASGVLSGVPVAKGTFTFSVRVTDDQLGFGTGQFTMEVSEPSVAVDSVIDAILGVVGALTGDEQRYLDLQGNRNGKFDVGDVAAFLRAHGQGAARALLSEGNEAGR